MSGIEFEWDERKNATNRRNHGIDFEEATTVFSDDHALIISDPDSSDDEERFVLLGLSSAIRTLVVCHCYRKKDAAIRIFSARKVNRQEQQQYNRRWKK